MKCTRLEHVIETQMDKYIPIATDMLANEESEAEKIQMESLAVELRQRRLVEMQTDTKLQLDEIQKMKVDL
jgi:hypothetical protein